jgi:hypothetical protein
MSATVSVARVAQRFMPPVAAGTASRPKGVAEAAETLLKISSLRAMFVGAAMLAAERGWAQELADIRQVLVSIGVDLVRFDIAVALVALRKGNPLDCLTILEKEVFGKDGDHELGRAVQVLAWRALGRPGWQAQANALLSTSADGMVRRLVG